MRWPRVGLADDRRVAAAEPHLGGDRRAKLGAAGTHGSEAGELRSDLVGGEELVGGGDECLHVLTLHLNYVVVNQMFNITHNHV
jgi:hypothetical protein